MVMSMLNMKPPELWLVEPVEAAALLHTPEMLNTLYVLQLLELDILIAGR